MSKQTVHQNNFDFFRIMAAIMVWYGHCFNLTGRPDPVSQAITFESFGSLGVTIFFIISGYFVTMSYDNHDALLPFVRNRALRILPALFAVVLLSVFVLGPCVTTLPLHEYFTDSVTWRYLRTLLVFPLQYDLPGVFTDNNTRAVNGSLWTLQHEVRLYGAIALLGVLGILRPRVMLILFLALFGIRFYGLFHKFQPKDIVWTFQWGKLELIIRLASEFAAGSLLYLLQEALSPRFKTLVGALVVTTISLYLPSGWGNIIFDLTFSYVLICLGFLKLPLLPYVSRWGDFSYGFYLYAFPVQQLTEHLLGKNVAFTAFLYTSFLATFVCAVLSWFVVEKPFLSLKG